MTDVHHEPDLNREIELLQNRIAALETALSDSEKKLHTLTDFAPVGIYMNNAKGETIYVNKKCAELVGVPVEEALHFDWIPFRHPDDREPMVSAWTKAVNNNAEFQLEYRWVHSDGEIVWTLGVAKPILADDGNAFMYIGTLTDITERRNTEIALQNSKARYKRLAENMPAVVFQFRMAPDGTFSFLFITESVQAVMGVAADEVKGDAHVLLDLIDPSQREAFQEAVFASARNLSPYEQELQVQRRGESGWVLACASPERQPDDSVLWEGFFQDVTERKQANLERERLRDQLAHSQKMESVGRLAGGVAHDFNNMLGVILGHTELALDHLKADHPLRRDLEEIQKAAERSANLTRQLLAFARRQTVAPKVLDLNKTIASMLQMLMRLIGEHIELRWTPGDDLALLRIDPGQVDQILANLAVNARDAISHQHGKVTVETANVCFAENYCIDHADFMPGDYVMLSVSDNGCGMDEKTRTRIFEPFFTTKDMEHGTGLGLATVYGIIKQNDGFINVYSEPDEGTTFRIYLPVLEGKSRRQTDMRNTAAAPAGGNETILIVEDEAAILRMTSATLERLGYIVLTAATPDDAIKTVRQQSGGIDLVITDVVMPKMNGRDLARKLQKRSPGLRILFMSGYPAEVIAHQYILEEGLNFIQKPFSREQLAVKVREALEG